MPRSRSNLLRLTFTLLVSLFAVWFLWQVLREVGVRNLADRLLSASVPFAAGVVILTVARYMVLALRWEILARREAPVGLGQITPVLMAGNFVALVTPVVRIAGPILRAYYLSRETGRPRSRFYGTIVADQAANFTIYAVVFAVTGALVELPAGLQLSPAGAGALLLALVGGLWVAQRMLREVHAGRPSMVSRLLRATLGEGEQGGWRRRLIAWWENLLGSLTGALVAQRSWWPALGLSVLAYALTVGPQILSFAAIGTRLGLVEVAFAVAGAGFAQVMLASPGGTGITEASLVAIFLALGVDRESALAGVLTARLLNYLVVAGWGGTSFYLLQRRYGRPAAAEPVRAA